MDTWVAVVFGIALLVGLFLNVAVILFILPLLEKRYKHLREHGLRLTARVTRVVEDEGDYGIHYSFQTPDGRAFTGYGAVHSDRIPQPHARDEVEILCRPDDPKINALALLCDPPTK